MIKSDTHNHITTLTIDRDAKKNALTQAMWKSLCDGVNEASRNRECRVVIITGSGQNFCAGADIREFDAVRDSAQRASEYELLNSALFGAIRHCPIPTIAAIQGVCFGGGFGIAAACDLRLADETARFCLPPAKLGLAYPVDAMVDIVLALGAQNAKHLAFSAKVLDARAALSTGFLMEVIAPTDFDQAVLELAQSIAALAPLSHRASKAAIKAVLSHEEGDMVSARTLNRLTFESEDYAEGRAAFAQKRQPKFRGE